MDYFGGSTPKVSRPDEERGATPPAHAANRGSLAVARVAECAVAESLINYLREDAVEGLIAVAIEERTTEHYRQERRGRPGPATRYVKHEQTRFDLSWRLAHDAWPRRRGATGSSR